VTIVSRAGKATGKYQNWYNVQIGENDDIQDMDLGRCWWKRLEDVNIILIPKSKHNDVECIKAKLTELEKLRMFDTYEVIKHTNQDCISTTWVLWNKGSEVRARLVARGFEEKEYVRSDSPTVGKSSMRVLLALAANFGWKVRTTDIKSAFLQGKILDREVFLIPPKEAEVETGYIWKLKRCLYGLNDAARQFYNSVVETLIGLGCEQSQLDPTVFYYKGENGAIQGVLVSHIDDFLHGGSDLFENDIMKKLRDRFLAGKIAEDQFQYVGFQIKQMGDCIIVDQNHYVDGLTVEKLDAKRLAQRQDVLENSEHTMLRSMAGKLNWVVQGTRPDLAYQLVEISMKFKNAIITDLNNAFKAIRHVKNSKCEILFPDLGRSSQWTLVAFSDASHANLCDGISSMMGYLVLLVGTNKRCCPLSWSGNKIRRVVRSTIAAETLSLQAALEDSIYLKSLIQELIDISIPIIAFVDNKSVIEALHSTKLVDDKRLRIDIGSLKQLLNRKEVEAIRWCPGNLQIANCLTKRGASNVELLAVLQSGQFPQDYDI
jgi:hypothetical protein